MFDAFMPVFCVLTMEILQGVIPYVMNEGVWVRGAAHEEFVCDVVDENKLLLTYSRSAARRSTRRNRCGYSYQNVNNPRTK